MKKILFTIQSLDGGGAEKVLMQIINKLKDEYKIDLGLIIEKGVYLDKIKRDFRVVALYDKKFCDICDGNAKLLNSCNPLAVATNKLLSTLFKIYRRLTHDWFIKSGKIYQKLKKSNLKYDVEIAFLEGPATLMVGASGSSAKKIAWVHTDMMKNPVLPKNRGQELKAYEKMDKIVCVSEDCKNSFLKRYPEFQNKVMVIKNPVDREEILKMADEDFLEDQLVIGEKLSDTEKFNNELATLKNFQLIRVISVGRLLDEKGQELLLQAHKELIDEGIIHELLILGDGLKRESFQMYIDSNNLQKSAKLLGFKSNPYKCMKQCDIFVNPSKYEGYSLVVAEALVLGLPVIATDCTGPRELLDNGKYGIITPVGDVGEMKKTLKLLIENESERKKYHELALERGKSFEIDSVIEEIKELLEI